MAAAKPTRTRKTTSAKPPKPSSRKAPAKTKPKAAPKAKAKPKASSTKARTQLAQLEQSELQLQEKNAAKFETPVSKLADIKAERRAAVAFQKARRRALISQAAKAGEAAGRAEAAGMSAADAVQLKRNARKEEAQDIAQQQQAITQQARKRGVV